MGVRIRAQIGREAPIPCLLAGANAEPDDDAAPFAALAPRVGLAAA
ncbi:hypothetical protein [Methylobacterium terrae]|nr:hypothetical protein [Methylobacterium terrae]